MRRSAAAVLAAAAAAITIAALAVSATAETAVRATVAVSEEGHPLDVRLIRIVDGLSPGRSYRLPAFGIRNHRGIRTAYRLVVSADPAQAERRPPQRWVRFLPAAVVIDAGRSRAVGVRLEVPDDAEQGLYAVVLAVRPGGSEGARLTFQIEPAESTSAWLRQAANAGIWVLPALVGAVLVVVLARGQHTGSKRLQSLRSTMRVRGDRKAREIT